VAKAEVDDVVDALEILYIRCDYSGAGLTGKHRDTDIIKALEELSLQSST
jgi:hypothetical protein